MPIGTTKIQYRILLHLFGSWHLELQRPGIMIVPHLAPYPSDESGRGGNRRIPGRGSISSCRRCVHSVHSAWGPSVGFLLTDSRRALAERHQGFVTRLFCLSCRQIKTSVYREKQLTLATVENRLSDLFCLPPRQAHLVRLWKKFGRASLLGGLLIRRPRAFWCGATGGHRCQPPASTPSRAPFACKGGHTTPDGPGEGH